MNSNKAKGTRYETLVVEHFRANGYPHVERRTQAGAHDRGDLAGIPGIVCELKATRALELAQFMTEAEVERQNAKADYGLVIWKRRQKPVGASAVILTLDQFIQLLHEAGR